MVYVLVFYGSRAVLDCDNCHRGCLNALVVYVDSGGVLDVGYLKQHVLHQRREEAGEGVCEQTVAFHNVQKLCVARDLEARENAAREVTDVFSLSLVEFGRGVDRVEVFGAHRVAEGEALFGEDKLDFVAVAGRCVEEVADLCLLNLSRDVLSVEELGVDFAVLGCELAVGCVELLDFRVP